MTTQSLQAIRCLLPWPQAEVSQTKSQGVIACMDRACPACMLLRSEAILSSPITTLGHLHKAEQIVCSAQG